MLRKLFANDWKVDGYTINPKNMLGQGAYGVVYKAKNTTGTTVAAKRIDLGRKHVLPDLAKNVGKLKQLKHPNIVKVYDMVQEENVIWMFMELCEHWDLNKYCREKNILLNTKHQMMSQIAEGVAYLHRNNVVHRDIKPENILVAHDSPIQLKLTDFDVSKFFEEIFDTSAMSTNVGTLAFKAPEFFQRTPDGKLVYHRNVDVYAMGLTFLALLQANSETKQLKPHIETYKDSSEKYTMSIGQLIAERKKYNVKELGVIADEDSASGGAISRDAILTQDLRVLIQKMTHVDPEQRSPAENVCADLEKGKPVPDVKLTAAQTFNTPRSLDVGTTFVHSKNKLFVNSKNHLFVLADFGSEHFIEMYSRKSGRRLKEIKRQCEHMSYTRNAICEHPSDPDRLLQACLECGKIRYYNIKSDQWKDVYTGKVYKICGGPTGTVLGVDDAGKICQFEWNEGTEELQICHTVESNIRTVYGMCYAEQQDVVIVSTSSKVCAFSRIDGSVTWKYNCDYGDEDIYPSGVCCDDNGRIYVACDSGVLILDSLTGERLQQLIKTRNFYDIFWTKIKPQLTVDNGPGISTFYVNEI